jgi:hypothetical protein
MPAWSSRFENSARRQPLGQVAAARAWWRPPGSDPQPARRSLRGGRQDGSVRQARPSTRWKTRRWSRAGIDSGPGPARRAAEPPARRGRAEARSAKGSDRIPAVPGGSDRATPRLSCRNTPPRDAVANIGCDDRPASGARGRNREVRAGRARADHFKFLKQRGAHGRRRRAAGMRAGQGEKSG